MIVVRLLFLAALLISCGPQPNLATPASSGAQSAQEVHDQDLDQEVGSIPLGSSIQSIPPGARRSASCYEGDRNIDCEFQRNDGVHYLVFGRTLTRKRILLDGSRRENLPFGLQGDETEDAALAALNARPGPDFTRSVVDGRVTLTTERLQNASGYDYWAFVGIGADGRLEEMGVAGVTE